MKTIFQRLLSLVLALSMALSLSIAPVWAAEEADSGNDASLSTQGVWWKGSCGESAKWDTDWNDEEGTCTLIISGTGAVSNNFVCEDETTEFSFKDRVVGVVVESGITGIDEYALSGFENLESVTLNEGLRTIESYAFLHCPKLKSITLPQSLTMLEYASVGFLKLTFEDELGEEASKTPGFTIQGYSGSEAETYAKKYKFTFQSVGKAKAPSKTTLSSAEAQKGKKVKVKWKKNNTAARYELQYSTDKKFKKGVKTVKVTNDWNEPTSKTVKSLKAGKTYYFRIRAVRGSLSSGWSGVKSAKVKK